MRHEGVHDVQEDDHHKAPQRVSQKHQTPVDLEKDEYVKIQEWCLLGCYAVWLL
jgi:hypothetical protein